MHSTLVIIQNFTFTIISLQREDQALVLYVMVIPNVCHNETYLYINLDFDQVGTLFLLRCWEALLCIFLRYSIGPISHY